MTKYKIKNIGLILLMLFVGIVIGWLLKPSPELTNIEGHDSHNHSITENAVGDKTDGEESIKEIWTCSMHPQIRQEEPGLCPICEMDLIPLDNSMSNDDPTILQMSKEAAKLAQIETIMVGGAKITQSSAVIAVEGSIGMNERSIKSQTSHLAGRVDEMYVNFSGDYVRAGQKIATIYSTELLAASQELITADKYESKVSGIRDASIQKLKNWKITDEQINLILSSKQPIETIDVYSDYSGYVLDKKVSQGDHVKLGQSFYSIGNTGRLWLKFNLYESDIPYVRIGQKVIFSSPSMLDKKLTTKITYIDPILNSKTRTVVVRAEISNRGNLLKPGMLITGEIYGSNAATKSNKISIPSTAVLWTGTKSVVYVQVPDMEVPSYQYRQVTIGRQDGNQTAVLEGLEVGEEIVVNGAFSIDAAAQLNNNLSMMNGDITIKKDKTATTPNYQTETPVAFKIQLNELINEYIKLKDALVATNAITGSSSAKLLKERIDVMDMSLLKGEAHMYWMEQLMALQSHTEGIIRTDDVEKQRKQFDFLSEALIKSIEAFGTSGDALYVMYCPMAFKNQGANWISDEKVVKNPYFGDKMMKCGLVKKEI